MTLCLFAVNLMVYHVHPAGVHDDYWISVGLSQVWPDNDYCLFLNAATGQFVSWLSEILPAHWNCFILLELILGAVSYFLAVYLALEYLPTNAAAAIICALVLIGLPYCTYWNNFTVFTTIATSSGFFALTVRLTTDRISPPTLVAGVILIVCGSLLRFSAFLMAIPFFGIIVIMKLLSAAKGGMGRALGTCVPIIVALALSMAAFGYDRIIAEQPDYVQWNQENNARSQIADYPMQPYEDVAKELSQIGISENDYYLLTHGVTNDIDYFTVEKLNEIHRIASVDQSITPESCMSAFAEYFAALFTGKPLLLGSLVLCIILMVPSMKRFKRREWVSWSLCMILALCFCIYFTAIKRLPDRAECSIWLYFIVATALLAYRPLEQMGDSGKGLVGKLCTVAIIGAIAVEIALAIPYFSPSYAKDLFRNTPTKTHVVVEYEQEHPDSIFIMDNTTRRRISEPYHLRTLPDSETQRRTFSLSGWASCATYNRESAAEQGVSNPMKALAEQDDVYLVATSKKQAKSILEYIREHYYPDATYKRVALLNDGNRDFYIYEFSQK